MNSMTQLNSALTSMRQCLDEISLKIDNGISLDKDDIETLKAMPPLLKKARNLNVYFLYKLGLKYDDIGRRHNISPARISQILSEFKRR